MLLISRAGEPVPLADIWDFERRVNPDAASATRRSTPTPSTCCATATGSSSPTRAATRSTRSTPSAASRTSRVFPNRPVPNPFAAGPPIPMQAVRPRSTKGPDGHYYVSQLTGFPFPAGGANIYRVNPRTGQSAPCSRRGFTNIMDLAFGRDGTLYVLEIDHDSLLTPANEGALFAIPRAAGTPDQAARRHAAVPRRARGRRRRSYVSINARSPGGGQVLKIRTHR